MSRLIKQIRIDVIKWKAIVPAIMYLWNNRKEFQEFYKEGLDLLKLLSDAYEIWQKEKGKK